MCKCERCGESANVRTCSMFNIDMICYECVAKEKVHPDYKKACDIEREHVRNGNMNFEGIGLPEDLKPQKIINDENI